MQVDLFLQSYQRQILALSAEDSNEEAMYTEADKAKRQGVDLFNAIDLFLIQTGELKP